jgi:aspartyl-tRNA(Asn)/glutamyl-tRNA(Gln) amidotransferase subunit A
VQNWRASPARSHNGPIARTVRDAALLMQALAGPHPADPDSARHPEVDYLDFVHGNVHGARVAVSRDFGRGIPLDDEQTRNLEEAIAVLRSLGCTLVDADPPVPQGGDELALGVWAYSGDHYAAAEALIPNFWEKHSGDLTDYTRPIYDAGRHALAWHYRRILRRDRAFGEEMRQWFAGYDFLLSPCCPPAPPNAEPNVRDDNRGQMKFLAPFNHAYNPAAAVPMGYSADGLPLAVQVVGKLGDDVGTLRLAGLIEAAKPWAGRWPTFALTR